MEETSNKRIETRFGLTVTCEVFYGPGSVHSAMLKDISGSGAMIDYSGGPLPRGEAVTVHIALRQMLLSRPATVVWSRGAGGERAASGVKFLAPVPVISLIVLSKEAKDHLFN